MLDSNGDKIPPYEQRWVMRSAWRLALVGAVAGTELRRSAFGVLAAVQSIGNTGSTW
jgi:hypothetical protein